MEPITIGTKGSASVFVQPQHLACAVGSGSLPVFATPMMAALMEQASCNAIAAALKSGETTVGTMLQISHTAPTPAGMTVTAEAEVTGVCGREISYHVIASDDSGVIGEGSHKRFLVNGEKFSAKAAEKLESEQ